MEKWMSRSRVVIKIVILKLLSVR